QCCPCSRCLPENALAHSAYSKVLWSLVHHARVSDAACQKVDVALDHADRIGHQAALTALNPTEGEVLAVYEAALRNCGAQQVQCGILRVLGVVKLRWGWMVL